MATRRQTRAPRKHYTVDMDLDREARPVTLDARSLTLPSVAVIAVVISSITLTYFVAEERSRIDTRIDTVVTSVERLAVSIKQLAEGLRYGNSDRFTTTHFQLFCARAEIQNKTFKCPNMQELSSEPTRALQGTLNSVGGEMDSIGQKLKTAKPEGR
jgi:hypothetical protein